MKAKLEKPKTLRQLASRHWHEIDHGTLVFDRPVAEAAELRKLSKQDVVAFFQVRTDGHLGFRVCEACEEAPQKNMCDHEAD